jgi:hypothetical protein
VWSREISEHLEGAQIILLLISDAFLNSDYCYGVEMKRALAKHEEGSACVIPIILRHVYWKDAPFSHLQALPTKGDPVVGGSWKTEDEAFTNIVKDISKTVKSMRGGQDNDAFVVDKAESKTEELPVGQSKERADARKEDGQKTQRQIVPGGIWEKPQNGTVVGDYIELAAFAYPTERGDPPIQRVEFTVGWSGYWQIAQTIYPQSTPDARYFRCEIRLSELFKEFSLPAGEINVSFDVYDQQGNKNAAPHGTRTLTYRPTGTQGSQNALEKGMGWLEQNVRRMFGKP